MYSYFINVLTGNYDDDADGSLRRAAAAEAARSVQRREAILQQRLLVERRRAYAQFISETPLGTSLASHLPPAEVIPDMTGRASLTDTGAANATTTATADTASASSSTLTSSCHDTEAAGDAGLEAALYAALRPRLSRETTIVTARVLELLGHSPYVVSPKARAGPSSAPPSPTKAAAATTPSPHRVPYLLVSLLLHRWRTAVEALSTELEAKLATFATLTTLRRLSSSLVSLVAVMEANAEATRACLEELRLVAAQCFEETLRCLLALTRAHASAASHGLLGVERADAARLRSSAFAANSPRQEGPAATTTQQQQQHPSTYVEPEVLQVQVWRLLSLLLYWLHSVHGAVLPHLSVVSVFLTTSAAAFDPEATGAQCRAGQPGKGGVDNNKGVEARAWQADELHRCTGLSNAALLRQAYVVPGTASSSPAAWLLSSAMRGAAARTTGASLTMALMTSPKVRESLVGLLLIASKGVIPGLAPFTAATPQIQIFKKYRGIEMDHDLGFVVVLACRLLHYGFVATAGTTAPMPGATATQHVGDAVSPLLGALSILLARFIAEEHALDAGRPARDGGDHGATHVDPVAACARSARHSVSAFPEQEEEGEEAQERCVRAAAGERYPRQARLLGQLGCGLLLLTTLFQQGPQAVLDTMDQSFFFDALVTALQAVGQRFLEPEAPLAARSAPPDAAAQRWCEWVAAVDDVSTPEGKDSLSTLGELPTVESALSAALMCSVDDHFAVLCDAPLVDEFLHAYLGLLCASRRLRAAPLRPVVSRGLRDGDNSLSFGGNGVRLEGRSVDTLDQLEQTLVKTFLTAYEVVDAHAATLPFTDASVSAGALSSSDVEGELAHFSPFPRRSCLYSLLLKHALWCSQMAQKLSAEVQQVQQQQQPHALLLPPPAHLSSSATLGNSSKASALTTPVPSLLLATSAPLLSPPSTVMRSFSSSPTAGLSISPCVGPASLPSVGGDGQDDPFLLFLIHHGLFRVLLHDEHFAAAFMLPPSSAGTRCGAATQGEGWQRSFVTLLLLSRCLQLRPATAADSSEAGVSATSHDRQQSSLTSLPASHRPEAVFTVLGSSGRPPRGGLLRSEELVAHETVEALVAVLRPPSQGSQSSPPPPQLPALHPGGASVTAGPHSPLRRVSGARWRNCLLALLSLGLGPSAAPVFDRISRSSEKTSRESHAAAVSAAAADVVGETLVRCGGAEYLISAAVASAGASSQWREASFHWPMHALRGLVRDPVACVHMAAVCAKPLLLRLLWHPVLRRDGRRLLTALLCQPLLYAFSATDASMETRETAASAQSMASLMSGGGKSGATAGGSSATASSADPGMMAGSAAHGVPRHCRKLSEAVWRVLTECVHGSPPTTNSALAEGYLVMATAGPQEREAVLQAVLAALVEAFRVLGSDAADGLASTGELLPLRTLQRAVFDASRDGSMHVYALLLHRLAQSWTAHTPPSPRSPASFALPTPSAPAPVCVLLSADETMPSASVFAGEAGRLSLSRDASENVSGAVSSRDTVVLIAKVLSGLTKANPTQREVLYRNTIDEDALVECLANAWSATVRRAARSESDYCSSSSSRAGSEVMTEESELARLCSYLVYESVDAMDAFLAGPGSSQSALDFRRRSHSETQRCGCAWSLQNPLLLAALLRRFVLRPTLTAGQQAALRQILRTLRFTVEMCHTSLYLAASTSLHEVLGQLLPTVALLPPATATSAATRANTASSTSANSLISGSSTRLVGMLVDLLVMLARCHVDVRQLKQMLTLVTHSRHLRERRALVPLVVQVLSAAAQPAPKASLRPLRHRVPHHFMALHRGSGPAGFRAALPEFPLEGYSMSLYVRWEGDGDGDAVDATELSLASLDAHSQRSSDPADYTACCACIFSLRTADRVTVLALMVERHTGQLFVQYRNLQQQEVRIHVAATLPSREWSLVVLSHRPAAFLTAAAGGQLVVGVNDAEVATVPHVTYPLMSRGHLYVGCLGHEVDRLSVAHNFYGQVSTVHFFPFVLQDREREILQSAARAAERSATHTTTTTAATTTTTTPLATPPMRPVSISATASRWPGAATLGSGGVGGTGSGGVGIGGTGAAGGGGGGVDSVTEQWLADRATLRVDTRLSDRGHLYNLSAVLRGRAGRESRLLTFEGTLVCSTQPVMDSMGLLGALPSVVMPLCTLLVNPSLPISLRGLVAAAQHSRDPPALPSWAVTPSVHTGGDYDPGSVDATNAALLWALELIPALASSEAIRNEMADSGLFVFLGQILQLLGPSLQVVVPAALLQLLEALVHHPRLFEDALTNLFLSSEVIHAAPRVVQLRWVCVQQAFLRAHADALACLRSLGTSMFVATEVLRVAAEEQAELGSDDDGDSGPPLTAAAGATPGAKEAAAASCVLRDLEHQWMLYFEALTVSPVTISEAQSLQYLVENLHWSCAKAAVQLRLLRRIRRLVASSTSPFFVQLLGRKNYAVCLIPYIKSGVSEEVRMEALLQLLCMVFRSKRTQELMNPVLLSSRDTVVHVAEEVSLSWLKDMLREFPVTLPVYLTLRCGLVGQFEVAALPTEYVPLDETQTLKFAAVLLPLLMLMKRSTDPKLKAYVLTDLAVLLKSDALAWRRVIGVRGWYVSLVGLFASPCVAPAPVEGSSGPDGAPDSDRSEAPASRLSSGILFTTTTMILSYTLFQVLQHESYGATELALVAAYLREQRLHRLLHQVLCGIADRYRSRLLVQWAGRRSSSMDEAAADASTTALSAMLMSEGAAASPSATASAATFIGLGSPTALLNFCYYFRVVEITLFYAAVAPRRDGTAAAAAAKHPMSSFASSSSSADGVALTLPSRSGYTEWEELTLLPAQDETATAPLASAPAKAKPADVYYAREEDDPQGNVRRAILRDPDGRWLHLPLAAKCAELLCSHSALLHLGSNGNATSISVGGSGPVVGITGASSGGPGDALLAVLLAAAASGGGVATASGASGSSGAGVVGGGAGAAVFGGRFGRSGPAVVKGGMLRLFARLFHAVCRMTLRSPTALDSIVNLVDCFVRRVDRGQRGGGFLLIKRAVNADEAYEHSPIAVSQTMIYSVHDLLLRRLNAAENGGTAAHPSANAALVDRMKSIVELYRGSFQQLPTFVASAAMAARWKSPTAASAVTPSHRRADSLGGASRRGSQRNALRDVTGEVHTSGMPTLQWLCDRQANPRRTVEAFAEVASRPDYNAFMERCLAALEREQTTNKALAPEQEQMQRVVLLRLQNLFTENGLSRRLVCDNITSILAASTGQHSAAAGGDGATALDDSADASFTSFFLPSAARKVTAAARAATWARFTTALRGTVWNLEAAGPQQQQQQQQQPVKMPPVGKFVKLSTQEQQPLIHRKLIYDRDGTNYHGVSKASFTSPTSPTSNNASMARPLSVGAETVANDGGVENDSSLSTSLNNSRASRLRLRGGEALLLQVPEDDDAAAEEELLRLSAEADARSFNGASLSEYSLRDTLTLDQLRLSASVAATAAASPFDRASASVLSVACEVPYMMHCWSASFTVRGSEVFVLIDDVNKAYNQVVSEDAKPYLLRPRTFSFHLSHVTQIAPGRRFRMRRTALEVWLRDRRSYFINFADAATMNAALQALRAGGTTRYPFTAPYFLRSATGAVTATLPALIRHAAAGGGRHTVYVLQENPRREPMRLRAMALWRNRLLSNFDYLLVLNLLAGRTLNDMTQYPVFPWILADYTSAELDLTNPASFRDLAQPMGACGGEERRAMVRERYAEMRDLGDVPSHYFTHYSSPAVTLYFLIRLPPYTTLSILLQGGHFDHADRMFHSVQASYKAVTTSTQDVRELIPELFYLPELCLNANRVDFGRRQDRTPMDDLQLPPWAHNDAYTFTYRMREALESPHVSAHLHEWIDLIFGYKQRGKDAIDALNVFNWHSYEELDRNREAGAIDHQLLIDSLDNIGQTPIQLFRQPHLARPVLEWADPLTLPTQVKTLPLRWGCARVAKAVVLASDKVLVVTGNGAAASLRMHINLIRQAAVPQMSTPSIGAQQQQRGPSRSPEGLHGLRLTSSVSGGDSAAGGRTASPAPLLGTTRSSLSGGSSMAGGAFGGGGGDSGSFDVSEEYERRIAPIPAGVIPNNSPYADGSTTSTSVALLCYDSEVFLVLGGLYDNSVVIRALSRAASDVHLRAHHGRVVFVVRTDDSRYLITGAEDTTFAVWSCQLQPDRQRLEVELLFTIYGHEDMPSAADVSSPLDVVATASLDGVLMLHSLSTGTLDRVLRHPHNAPIHHVLLQTSCYVPNLIVYSERDGCVYQYSINGALLRTFTPPGRITTWAATGSQYFLLACQPHAYLHGNSATTRATRSAAEERGDSRPPSPQPPPAQATTPCILYVHSFFLEVLKTVPVPADHVVSSLSAHPSYPQVVVAGTDNGRLLLLRSVTS